MHAFPSVHTDGGQIKGKNLNKRLEKHIECRCFRAPGLTEWFGEYERDVNKMLRPLQSPDLNPVEHLGRFWTNM